MITNSQDMNNNWTLQVDLYEGKKKRHRERTKTTSSPRQKQFEDSLLFSFLFDNNIMMDNKTATMITQPPDLTQRLHQRLRSTPPKLYQRYKMVKSESSLIRNYMKYDANTMISRFSREEMMIQKKKNREGNQGSYMLMNTSTRRRSSSSSMEDHNNHKGKVGFIPKKNLNPVDDSNFIQKVALLNAWEKRLKLKGKIWDVKE